MRHSLPSVVNLLSICLLLLGVVGPLGRVKAAPPKDIYGYYNGNIVPAGATGMTLQVLKDERVCVDNIQVGTPAHGKVSAGDTLLSVNGSALQGRQSLVTLGNALTAAEAGDGLLRFEIKPAGDGPSKAVTLSIPPLGAYGKTIPLDCEKSKTIIRRAAEFYAGKDRLKEHNHLNGVVCLFLLSTGDDKYVSRVKEYFAQFLTPDGKVKGIESMSWDNGYNGVACAEYYLRTGDRAVLPILQYYCDDAKARQLYNSGWNHWDSNVNPKYEAGGGLMNPAGNQLLLTLVMGRMCGVNVDENTLKGALTYFYRFIGHGCFPISDQRAWGNFASVDRAGATAAVMRVAGFAQGDVGIYKRAEQYLTMYLSTSWPSNLWDTIWYDITSGYRLAYNADQYAQTQRRYLWAYDLYRLPSGGFHYPPGHQTLNQIDAGAAVALAFTAPLKTLCITGAPRSKYARDFTLPQRLWGNDTDLAFLSPEPNKDFGKFGEEEDLFVTYARLPLQPKYPLEDVKELDLDMMLRNARHARYEIRQAAGKALCMNKRLDELERLLRDPDPRLRRAALDGINDYRPWFLSSPVGVQALKAGEYTPAMIDAISAIMNDPKESWYVLDGAMLALSHAPVEAIRGNIPAILPWAAQDDWWLRESAFIALMGLEKDDELFVKYIPNMIKAMIGEVHYNPHNLMVEMLKGALTRSKSDSPAGRLIVDGLARAVREGVIPIDTARMPLSRQGTINLVEVALASIYSAPQDAAGMAGMIATSGRLKDLDTTSVMRILRSTDGNFHDRFVGLYPLLEKLPPEEKRKLTDILFDVFRPELIKRLNASDQKPPDSDLLDMIVDLTRLKTAITGWQTLGSPAPEQRLWRYCSVSPMTDKDKLPPQVGPPSRLREIALPAGMEDWIEPRFDDSKWKSGNTPIGAGEFIAHGHGRMWTANPNFSYQNKSDWGDGEFLLARSTFDVKDTKYDYYRIRILAAGGYNIYLNGKKINNYVWFSHYPVYQSIMLGQKQMNALKQGANTLAVYANMLYLADKKVERKYYAVGQLDLVLEGLRKTDAGLGPK